MAIAILLTDLSSITSESSFQTLTKKKYVYRSKYKVRNKDKCDPTNYRGITLSSVVSKLFEKLNLSRFKNDFANNNVSFPHILQFGFKCNYDAYHLVMFKRSFMLLLDKGTPVFCGY